MNNIGSVIHNAVSILTIKIVIELNIYVTNAPCISFPYGSVAVI